MAPGPVTLYAIGDRLGTGVYYFDAPYVETHVTAVDEGFSMTVPPGIYRIVARLDSDPNSAAAYTTNFGCLARGCTGTTHLDNARVESGRSVAGITVGDWGTVDATSELADIDLWGRQVDPNGHLIPAPSASTASHGAPYRLIPTSPSPTLSAAFNTGVYNDTIQLPAEWRLMPQSDEFAFANEDVRTPLALSGSGIWLYLSLSCGPPPPSPTALGNIVLPNGKGYDFYFYDRPAAQTQPLMGFKLVGTTMSGDRCFTFVFAAQSGAARDANLATFVAIVRQTRHVSE